MGEGMRGVVCRVPPAPVQVHAGRRLPRWHREVSQTGWSPAEGVAVPSRRSAKAPASPGTSNQQRKMLIISEQKTSKPGRLSPEPGCGAEGCVLPPSRAASRPPGAPAPSPGAQLRLSYTAFLLHSSFFFPRVGLRWSRGNPPHPGVPLNTPTLPTAICPFRNSFFSPRSFFFSISQSSSIFRFSSPRTPLVASPSSLQRPLLSRSRGRAEPRSPARAASRRAFYTITSADAKSS